MQPNFLPRHSPTVSCLLSLHIEKVKVSGIFPVALTQVVEPKKNPECGRSKEQRSPARIVSGAGSLKCPGSLKSWIGEEWGMFFYKAVSKGLPRPFNAAGWRCSKYMPFRKHLTPTMTNLYERHVSYPLEDNYPFVGSCPSTNFRSFPTSFFLLFSLLLLECPSPKNKYFF